MRQIVKPGTPFWRRVLGSSVDRGRAARLQRWLAAGVLGAMAVGTAVVGLGAVGPGTNEVLVVAGAALIFGAPLSLGIASAVAVRGVESVTSRSPKLRGVPITGHALALLEDIDARFAYAERLVGEIPTGIDWPDVEESVDALLWEAAEEAAKVSAIDAEVHDMRYAEAGTAQHVYRRELQLRSEEHRHLLEDLQREAESLARTAGNAAAAAKVALARTGSLAALDVAMPTPRGLVAREALEAARARLAMLADVWAEISEAERDVRAAQATLERGDT